ncbi:MAG: sigma-70 family RNA polymerase sigma factor [Polyangiaceae bacterium]|nr:sigma-70 family RNA polymerase sigma factor [Polyangiaceae bacterium]
MLRLAKSNPRPADSHKRHDDLGALAEAARRGEPKAVRMLTLAIGPSLLRVVRRVVGPTHPDVEDLTQEAAFCVLEALPRYRGECSVLHFACRVAVLSAMNARRRHAADKRSSLEYTDLDLNAVAGSSPTPEQALASRDTLEIARKLLLRLPESQAEALALHCVLGFTVAEIARSTGVRAETVRSRLRLATRALRTELLDRPAWREAFEGAS